MVFKGQHSFILGVPRKRETSVFGHKDSAALEADDVWEDSDCGLSLRQLRGESTIGIQRHRVDPDPTEEASEPSEPETAAAAAAEAETGPEVESESSTLVEPDEEMDDTGEDDEGEEPMPKVNETKLQNERETEEGGLCCFSGESNKDTCATCYPMSIASFKSKCSKKNECTCLSLYHVYSALHSFRISIYTYIYIYMFMYVYVQRSIYIYIYMYAPSLQNPCLLLM